MAVDLLSLPILDEETTENAHAANPDDLGGKTGLTGTLSLTGTGVATLSLGIMETVDARARVDGLRLADDESILHQLAHMLA